MMSRDNLARMANADDIETLFQCILGRSVNNDEFLREWARKESLGYWVKRLINSKEFSGKFAFESGFKMISKNTIPDTNFRAPSINPRVMPPRILVTGSCLSEGWKIISKIHSGTDIVHVLFNNASTLPDMDDEDLRSFTFQVGQIGVRSIVSDVDMLSSAFGTENEEKANELFRRSVAALRINLGKLIKYNQQMGLPLFVLNFAVPQVPLLGKLFNTCSMTNFSWFMAELNCALEEEARRLREEGGGIYIIDFNGVLNSIGKRYFMDDVTSHSNHSAMANSAGSYSKYDLNLTPVGDYNEIFALKTTETILAAFEECCAVHETITSDKKIKLVIFDLDGTLWRGVAADSDDVGPHMTEGWPLGILEAASILKKRGILIAICSKNDLKNVQDVWSKLYEKKFSLENFVSIKANWNSKAMNIQDILNETNLLQNNVLFVDDNPVERELVKQAFPEINVISGTIGTWRRTLLWASELQVPYVTEESRSRSDSIKGMIAREQIRTTMNDTNYLADLQVEVTIGEIYGVEHKRFQRAFELLNKTNQFNSTGVRWSDSDMKTYLGSGGKIIYAEVADRLNDYGLTAVMLAKQDECTQFVMSCRIFGLKVEFCVFDYFVNKNRERDALMLRYCATDKNAPVRGFLAAIGFSVEQINKNTEPCLSWRRGMADTAHLCADVTTNLLK